MRQVCPPGGVPLWIENNSGVMRFITQELWTKVQAKHGHYLIILDLSKSKEYTAIIKFIKPKTPIMLSAVTKISSCRVYEISGRGIVQAMKFFCSHFLFGCSKSSQGSH